MARAYFLPLRGLEGAGDGGKSFPSKSKSLKALPNFPAPPFPISGFFWMEFELIIVITTGSAIIELLVMLMTSASDSPIGKSSVLLSYAV